MNPSRCTIPKKEILRGYQTVSAVLSTGKSLKAGNVRCFYTEGNGNQACVRVGFTVSRAVSNAVMRNRLRRLLREAYRLNKSKISLARGDLSPRALNLVFMFLPGGKTKKIPTYQAVERSVITLLDELHRELVGHQ